MGQGKGDLIMTEPTRIDQKVRDIASGRIGTTIRVAGMQDPRVHLSHAKRLFIVQWDDTGGKQNVWSDQLSTT